MEAFMVDYFLPHLWYVMAAALTIGLLSTIGIRMLRKRVGPVGQKRLTFIELAFCLLGMVSCLGFFVLLAIR